MEWKNYAEEYVIKNKILAALGVVVGVWILFKISKILLALFIAYLVATGFAPITRWLRKKGINRGVAAGTPILLVVASIIGLLVPLWFIFTSQLGVLIENIPMIIDEATKRLPHGSSVGQALDNLMGGLGNVGNQAIIVTGSVTDSFFFMFLVLFICFYFLYDYEKIVDWLLSWWSKKDIQKVRQIMEAVDQKLGSWTRGQVILSVSLALLSYVAYLIIRLPYAEVLALLAGFLEFIPYFGPALALVPAGLVALTVSPNTFWMLIIVYIIIQLVESYLLGPRIMERAVGIYPLLIVIGLTVGLNLFGVAGALLAVPVISVATVVWGMKGKKLD